MHGSSSTSVPTDRAATLTTGWRWALVAFAAVCLAAAAYLRFHHLGEFPFWEDEYFHVFSAQSYLKDGIPRVPYYGTYNRAFPITWMTAFSFKHFGVSELAARAPFAATNVLFVLVSFLFVRRIFGVRAAAGTLFVLAFSPFMTQMSHECRMYTVFQLLYFTASMAFLLGFEPLRRRPGLEGRWGVDLRWLAASVLFFLMSLYIHDLTFTGFFVVAPYLFVMFLWEWHRHGFLAALRTRYGVATVAMVAGAVAAFLIMGAKLIYFLEDANTVPLWEVTDDKYNYYRRLLTDAYPVFFLLYPLGAVKFIRDHGRRGLFAVASFTLLFVFHSYLFARRSDRYIFYIFPFFVLVSAAVSADGLAWLARSIRAAAADLPRPARLVPWLAAAPVLYLFLAPWFMTGLHGARISRNNTAVNHAAEVRTMVGDATVIHTNPLDFLHYQKRAADYFMVGEIWDDSAMGDRLIRNIGDLRKVLDLPGRTVIVTEGRVMGNPAYFTPEMTRLIESRCRLVISALDRRNRYYIENLPGDPVPAA